MTRSPIRPTAMPRASPGAVASMNRQNGTPHPAQLRVAHDHGAGQPAQKGQAALPDPQDVQRAVEVVDQMIGDVRHASAGDATDHRPYEHVVQHVRVNAST